MATISIVSPVFQAAEIVPYLVSELRVALDHLTDSYEIILVDDRSKDRSWDSIKAQCKEDRRVKGLRLSRNFGQHCAITAGLSHAKGDWVVVMDCDLQDRPDQIHSLYSKANEGYDIVYARRHLRQDSKRRRFYSQFFYFLFSYLTDTNQDPSIANFGIYNKKVVQAVLNMNDQIRYFPAMVQWVGFRSTSVDVDHAARRQGKSTYNLRKMIRLAINNIISFSDKPLRLVAQGGLILSCLSILTGFIFLVLYLLGIIKVTGYASLIISIWLTSGINIFVLGLVGIYVGKAFEKVKNRPLYILDEVLNND
jgi:glycosyltransferase involved in cell wall biosynthesis